MRRILANVLAALVGLVLVAGASLALTGTPLFGLLAGTGLQKALVPGPVAAVLAPEKPAGRGRGGPVPAEVATVTEGEVPVELSFSGRFIAEREVELRARVSGYLEERLFEEASFVTRGATLFRLDQAPFRTRLDELRAALEGARAEREFAREEAERIAELQDRDVAAESRLDEAESRRAQAEARVRELRASLTSARLDLKFSTIEAPFDGKIGFAQVDPGDLVTAGQTLLTNLVQYDPIEVEIRPSADQLARMRAYLEANDAPIVVRVRREGSDAVSEGEISGLGPAFEESTNTLQVRATVPNDDRALIPGQFARVTADLGAERETLVPTKALVTEQNQRALYRLGEDDAVEVVRVRAGREHEGRTVVEGGVEPGDRIVVGNLQSVRPGATVKPVEEGDGRRARAEGGGEATR
jgi:RND family efflux transporter MFP subunit